MSIGSKRTLGPFRSGPFRFKNLRKLPVLGSISGTFALDFQAHLQDHSQIPAPQPEDALAPHDVHAALEETSARCAGVEFPGREGGRLGSWMGDGLIIALNVVKMMRKSGENGMSRPWENIENEHLPHPPPGEKTKCFSQGQRPPIFIDFKGGISRPASRSRTPRIWMVNPTVCGAMSFWVVVHISTRTCNRNMPLDRGLEIFMGICARDSTCQK